MKDIKKDLEFLALRCDKMNLYLYDKIEKSKAEGISSILSSDININMDQVYCAGARYVYNLLGQELKKILIKQYGTTKTKHIRKTPKDTGGVKRKKTAKK